MPKDISKLANNAAEVSQPSLGYGDSVLGSLIGIIGRNKSIIFATVCLITSLTALISFKLTPKYSATAKVIISPRQTRFIGAETMVDQSSTARAMMESELKIITSKSHAQQVVEKLNLISDPEFNLYLHGKKANPYPMNASSKELLRSPQAGGKPQRSVLRDLDKVYFV